MYCVVGYCILVGSAALLLWFVYEPLRDRLIKPFYLKLKGHDFTNVKPSLNQPSNPFLAMEQSNFITKSPFPPLCRLGIYIEMPVCSIKEIEKKLKSLAFTRKDFSKYIEYYYYAYDGIDFLFSEDIFISKKTLKLKYQLTYPIDKNNKNHNKGYWLNFADKLFMIEPMKTKRWERLFRDDTTLIYQKVIGKWEYSVEINSFLKEVQFAVGGKDSKKDFYNLED